MKMRSAIGLALLAGAQLARAGLGIGDAVADADVKMKSVDGSMVSINDARGEKGTLVVFTCNRCPVVLSWQKEMVAIGNAYKDKGIGVIFINSNNPEAAGDTFEGMQELAKKEGYGFPYVVDATSGVAKSFGAGKTPDVFLFDAAGKLAYKGAVGEGGQKPKAGGEAWLKNALEAVLAGKPVAMAETKAVGCTIKFR